jgi:hypothetical protein
MKHRNKYRSGSFDSGRRRLVRVAARDRVVDRHSLGEYRLCKLFLNTAAAPAHDLTLSM